MRIVNEFLYNNTDENNNNNKGNNARVSYEELLRRACIFAGNRAVDREKKMAKREAEAERLALSRMVRELVDAHIKKK